MSATEWRRFGYALLVVFGIIAGEFLSFAFRDDVGPRWIYGAGVVAMLLCAKDVAADLDRESEGRT